MNRTGIKSAASNIHTRAQRAKLKPRKAPYYFKISIGRALGYRKTQTSGAWIARRVKRQKRIGGASISFTDALKLASEWFDRLDGGACGRYTVKQAVDAYTHRIEVEKTRLKARAYSCMMYRHIPARIMNTEIDNLTANQLNLWLQGLVMPEPGGLPPIGKSSANLHLNKLRVALNHAWNSGLVSGDKVWTSVKPLKGAENARELYLTPKQIGRLLEHAPGSFRNYCLAAILTGARPGEVANMHVRDFVQEHGTLRLYGKTGERSIFLSEEALHFFQSLANGRNPDEYLLLTDQGIPWVATTWGKAMIRSRQAAQLPSETVVYSLRHYYISRALLAGVSIQVIEKNCGTSMEMIAKFYGKFLAADRVSMLNKVSLIPD